MGKPANPSRGGGSSVDIIVSADISEVKPAIAEAKAEIAGLGKEMAPTAEAMRGAASAASGLKEEASALARGALGDLSGASGVAQAGIDLLTGAVSAAGSALAVVAVAAGATGAVSLLAFAAAAKEGYEETLVLNRALVLSGNQIGLTVGQIEAMAAQSAIAIEDTRGHIVTAMRLMIDAGNVGAEVLGKAAEAAVLLEKYGGPAVAETAKQFAELGKEPVKASLKLTEQTGFLTAAVFEQIKALEDQGLKAEAAQVAQSAYADASIERQAALRDSLGDLQRAWIWVGDAAKGAWDKMMDAGRKKTTGDLVAEVERDLRAGTTDAYGGEDGARAALARLQAAQQAEASQAAATGAQQAANKAAIAWQQDQDKFLDKQGQQQKELVRLSNDYLAARKAFSGDAAKLAEMEAEYLKRVGAINEKYVEKQPRAAATRGRSPGVDRDRQAVDQLMLDGRAADAGLTSKTLKELDALEAVYRKTNMSQEEYLRLAGVAMADDALIAANKRAVANEMKAAAEATQYLAELQGKFSRANEVKAMGLAIQPESAMRLSVELMKVDEQAQAAANHLAKMFGDGKLSAAAYAEQLAELNALTEQQKSQVGDLNRAQDTLNASWESGATRAMVRYGDQAKNVADATEQAFSRAFSGMEDALANFATTGKLNFSDMARSILADVVRIQVRSGLGSALSGGGGLLGSLFGALSGNASTAATYGTSAFSQQTSMLAAQDAAFKSFDGGGYTGDAARSGGIDGKGGFWAILHPQETVTDHTRSGPPARSVAVPALALSGGGAAGGGSVTVNLVNNGTPQRVERQQESVDSRGNRRIELVLADMVAEEQARPGSSMYNAHRRTFGANPVLVGR